MAQSIAKKIKSLYQSEDKMHIKQANVLIADLNFSDEALRADFINVFATSFLVSNLEELDFDELPQCH